MRKSSKVLWILVMIINLSFASCTATSLTEGKDSEVVATEGDTSEDKVRPDDNP